MKESDLIELNKIDLKIAALTEERKKINERLNCLLSANQEISSQYQIFKSSGQLFPRSELERKKAIGREIQLIRTGDMSRIKHELRKLYDRKNEIENLKGIRFELFYAAAKATLSREYFDEIWKRANEMKNNIGRK